MSTVTYTMFTYSLSSRIIVVSLSRLQKNEKFFNSLSSRSHCRHSPSDATSQCVASEGNNREMPRLGRINTQKLKSKVISFCWLTRRYSFRRYQCFVRRDVWEKYGGTEGLRWLHTNPPTYTNVLNSISLFSIFRYKLLELLISVIPIASRFTHI